jgi:putative PIN family toxin of toxin-antitoxin system
MILYQATAQTTVPAAERFRFLEGGRLTLFVSDDILEEARDDLTRPKVRPKNPRINDQTVAATFERLDQFAQKVNDIPSRFSLPRDPDDEPYLNLALASDVDSLVTGDKDLRTRIPRLTILTLIGLVSVAQPGILIMVTAGGGRRARTGDSPLPISGGPLLSPGR